MEPPSTIPTRIASHEGTESSWESLTPALLGRCLRKLPSAEQQAFATCKAFATALLSSATEPRVTLSCDDRPSWGASVAVLTWAAPCCVCLELQLVSNGQGAARASLKALLSLMHEETTTWPTVKSILCDGLLLDAVASASLGAIFPNLHTLKITSCSIPLDGLPLAGCSQLQRMQLAGASAATASSTWLHQLHQLPSLSALSAVHLEVVGYPSGFLPLLADQLTELKLQSRGIMRRHSKSDQQAWQAAVEAAAQCTNLRKLAVSHCAIQHLGLLTSLRQLREFELTQGGTEPSDALMSTLLKLPHLTHVTFADLQPPEQSHADSPCTWQQLRLDAASPQLLARLPLQSLTSPLQLGHLKLDQPGLTVADVRAAADNLARATSLAQQVRNCRSEGKGRRLQTVGGPGSDSIEEQSPPVQFIVSLPYPPLVAAAASVHTPAALLLRAAAPLIPRDITAVIIINAQLNADVVTALRAATPPTITHIGTMHSTFKPCFWLELARSFPSLSRLTIHPPVEASEDVGRALSTADVMSYFTSACARAAVQGPLGVPQAADIRVVLWDSEDEEGYEGILKVNPVLEFWGLRARVAFGAHQD